MSSEVISQMIGKSTTSSIISLFLNSNICSILHQDKYFKTDAEIPLVTYQLDVTYQLENVMEESNVHKSTSTHEDAQEDTQKDTQADTITVANWDCLDALHLPVFEARLATLKSSTSQFPTSHDLSPNRPRVNSILDFEKDPNFSDSLQLLSELQVLLTSNNLHLILVDGFLLYYSQQIIETLDLSLFFKASLKTLVERRAKRFAYMTPEGTWTDPPQYFEKVVYPEYLKNNALVLGGGGQNNTLVKSICADSNQPLHVVLYTALECIKNHCESIISNNKNS